MSETIGPFVGHYHGEAYCAACSCCQQKKLLLLASHGPGGCFMLALCSTCDGGLETQMWGGF